ncbi:MAG: hypothetical protein WDM71_10470 [Ferruginibacter sp.]
MSEGTIIYNVIIHSADASATILGNATVTDYLKGSLSRTEMSSSVGNEATIHDAKSGASVILKEYSGQKLMITLTKENWDTRNKKYDGLIFKYDNNGIKPINGYNCKKATTQLSDGSIITVYYTTDMNVFNKEYDQAFKNLNGFPVQYEVGNSKLKFIYTLSSVDFNTVPSAKFDFPKSGYRIMTYEESEQNKRGN